MIETCLYCGEPLGSDSAKRSQEHGLPESLGGKVGGANPLVVEAHKKCNNDLGRLVDSRFARGWLGRNTRFQAALRTTDPSLGRAIPLGPLAPKMHTFPDGRVMDFWLGPGKFNAYHVHEPWPRSPQIGRPLDVPRSMTDAGHVFIVPRTGYEATWWRVAAASFRKQFKGSPIYLGAANAEELGFLRIPEDLFPVRDEIARLANGEHKGTFDHDMVADMLLAAKIALVVGTRIFGEAYVASEDAQRLREYVWEKDADKRDALRIVMGHFLQESPKFAPILGFPDGHAILLIPTGDKLVLHVIIFGEYEATVVVAEDASKWRIERDGVAFAYSLAKKAAVGPVPLAAYIGWRGRPGDVPAIADVLGRAPPWPDVPEMDEEDVIADP